MHELVCGCARTQLVDHMCMHVVSGPACTRLEDDICLYIYMYAYIYACG